MTSGPGHRKISVQYSYTKNLGNYESERLQVGFEKDLDENESVDAAWSAGFLCCKEFVNNTLDLNYNPDEELKQQAQQMLSRRRARNAPSA
jgi:hypothetical protein